ncbi:MAG TPA: WD40 repeat domain-containing protein [Mycobacteriales bacterium]|nr:WD40 repeat domain-containing protein [Mycobacteriales bacterium]
MLSPSGSGKSSVVGAGLLPALRQGAVPGSDTWFPAEMHPGAHPFEELATVLTRVATTPQPGLAGTLRGGRTGLTDAVAGVLPDGDSTLLLVVDQFEEVFTLVEDDDERRRFLDVLAAAATDPCRRVRVVVTLRADFYDLPLAHPAIAELTSRGTCSVTPLLPGEIERAITGPAEAAGVSVQPALLAALVADVTESASSLPLLQYALTELFEHRDGAELTLSAYEAVGGVTGALASRAEELYAALPADGQLAARQLFLRLVTVPVDGGEYTRRRESRAQLDALDVQPSAMAAVVDAFGAGRLLTFDRDPVTRGPTVEVAHEALMREWSRLRGWLDAARDDVLTHRRLAAAARDWLEDEGDASALVRGERLRRFEEWAESSRLALTAAERRFLAASAARREHEQAESDRRERRERELERRSIVRLRAGVAVAIVLAMMASLLAVVALDQRSRAREEASTARARELAAAALATISQDPELSTLLALEAVAETGQDGTVLREAEEALHRAVQNVRVVRRFPQGGFGLGVSADGTRLVTGGSGSPDDVPTVWDAETGEQLLRLDGADGANTVAMSADGRIVASTDGSADVTLWDSSAGTPLRVLRGDGGPLSRLAFSRDGERLAAAGFDGAVRVWTVDDGRQQLTARGSDGAVLAVAFSPDGFRLATGGLDARVRLWDVRTGVQLAEMPGHEWPVSTVAFSPDGRSVASGAYDAEARIWDAGTGRLVRLLAGRQTIQSLAFSPDGARLLTATTDAVATVWDLARGREDLRLVGHSGGPVADVAFLPDGRRVLTSGLDGTTRMWDVSPSGARNWLTAPGVQQIYAGVTFSPDGSTFAAPAHPHGVTIWDSATGREVRTLNGPPQKLSTVAFSPDGTRLVAGSDVTRAPPVWDVMTGELLFTLDGGDAVVRAVTFSPDGTRIATAGAAGALRVWDAGTGAQVASVHDGEDDLIAVRYSPDGRVLVVGESEQVVLRDPDSLAPRRRLGGFTAAVSGLAFGPDDTLVASSEDATARVWSLTSGRELVVFRGHRGPVNQVAVSPDGSRVASSGEDGTTRLWGLTTGTETLRLVGHASLVYGVSFSPDGRLLATASPDGTVALHTLHIEELVDVARSRLTRGLTQEECRTYLHLDACPAASD